MFKKAVDTIIKFAKSIYNIMDVSDAKDIRDCVNSLARTDEDYATIANMLITYIDYKSKITDDEYFKMCRQVEDVVAGLYDNSIQSQGHVY